MILQLDTFVHNYQIEWPIEPGDEFHLYYPGGLSKGGRDGVLMRILPADGRPFVATFAAGVVAGDGLDAILACPSPDMICVVSKGAGYLVKASNPSDWASIPVHPIEQVFLYADGQVILLADYTSLACVDERGLRWVTCRIAWDGLKITDVDPSMASCSAWQAPGGKWLPVEVDLASGQVVRALPIPPT